MAKMSEKEVSFELIEALLVHIKNQKTPGAVLVFLPGWNLIFALMRHLQQHPTFGTADYVILPLHSQIPREEQRRVFDPVPDHVTKVPILYQALLLCGLSDCNSFGALHRPRWLSGRAQV